MGQDYSYSQPSSSSNSVDITSLIEAEAQLYADEAESSHFNAEPLQYQPQPECDDGIPTTCYCGAEPVVGYSTTRKDPYRRLVLLILLGEYMVLNELNIRKGFKGQWRTSLVSSQLPVDLDAAEPLWFGSEGPDEAYVMSGSEVPEVSGVKSTPQQSERRKL
ncbi:Uncharacterized protein Rs2_20567 [Raphanus sativus]|nr:Uncharacterized protein Rs2_20567 [Raphanus sativus]